MRRALFVFGAMCFLNASVLPITKPEEFNQKGYRKQDATVLLHAALEAMGGEKKVRSLTSIQIEGIGHTYAVEQSERPEGPYIVTYNQMKELRDLNKQRLRQTLETKQFSASAWRAVTLVVSDGIASFEGGGRVIPGNIVQTEDAKKQFALAPERILLTALEAADLEPDKDVVLQSVPHHVVKFTWNKVAVAIYLNANTGLPTAVDTTEPAPYEHFWAVWGDFTTRTFYSLWTLEPGGIHYPHQSDVEKNGYPFDTFTITDLKLNEPVTDASFNISDETKKAFSANPLVKIDDLPLGLPGRPAVEIAPGIVKMPGRWDVAYVRQSDGIVIIESPISSAYTVKILEDARKRFPNEKIKAVVSTSDAFPHLGGIREYVAQNIPIFALDVNQPIIERMLGTHHRSFPDNLERMPRRPILKIVSRKTVVGSGSNKMEIYPIRTETGERMMMIYFPEHKLLYSSDLVQPRRGGEFAFPQYLTEMVDAIKRENLTVATVFGMHLNATPWSGVTQFLNTYVGEMPNK